MGLAALLAAVLLLAWYWMTLEWRLMALRELLEGASGDEAAQVAELEQGVAAAQALSSGWIEHAEYHEVLSRLEMALGRGLKVDDPVAAFAAFDRAEQAALSAHHKRPQLPHDLLRAATARSERFLVDDRFAQYIVDANRLGPRDRGVATTTLLLVMEHYGYVSETLVDLAIDGAIRELLAGGDLRNLTRLLGAYRAWALVCGDGRIEERFERECARFSAQGVS